MTDRHPDRQTEWNNNKAHSLRCERDATDRPTDGMGDKPVRIPAYALLIVWRRG